MYPVKSFQFKVSEIVGEVSAKLILPEDATCMLLFAHGAGAGMNHSFMEKMAQHLAAENIGTIRFNFPYTERNGKRPDHASVLMQTIQSAVSTAKQFTPLPIFAGGKSMGGRMTSQAASKGLLPEIRGIVFFGFPLHAPGKPSSERAEHLYMVNFPMLFLQGTKDKLADLDLLKPVIKKLEDKATLFILDGADHSFKLPKSSGLTEEDIYKILAAEVKKWIKENMHN